MIRDRFPESEVELVTKNTVVILPEATEHIGAIDAVEQAAFGRVDEARLVSVLRAQKYVTLSLVALVNEKVVGNVLFSPLKFEPEEGSPRGVALGPVAVAPEYQHQGFGVHLIRAGLDILRKDGYGLVVLSGNPKYYGRLGFEPAHRYGVDCTFQAPRDYFMLLELAPGGLSGWQGTVHYHPEFDWV